MSEPVGSAPEHVHEISVAVTRLQRHSAPRDKHFQTQLIMTAEYGLIMHCKVPAHCRARSGGAALVLDQFYSALCRNQQTHSDSEPALLLYCRSASATIMYFSINQLGRLAVLLLISTPFVAQAQKAGSSCGPVYDKTARWMSIPAKSLSATSPAGPVSVDSTGCVTSDEGVAANVHAALPWGTWTVYNISAKVKATKAAAKSSFMQVMIGSVGMYDQGDGRCQP